MNIKYGSAQVIVHDDLGYHKVCARWVPKQLTPQRKDQRVDIATQFLKRYDEDHSILELIVKRGDESGREFSSDDEVQEAVQTWLCELPKISFSDRIQKLAHRYLKCNALQGDYVKK